MVVYFNVGEKSGVLREQSSPHTYVERSALYSAIFLQTLKYITVLKINLGLSAGSDLLSKIIKLQIAIFL